MRHYAAYGDPFGAQGSLGTPFGFTGEQTDANGLVYLRARHYAPSVGIFPSLDPFEGDPSRPMSLNGYSWVEGNVPNMVDPSGMIGERPEEYENCTIDEVTEFNFGNCYSGVTYPEMYGTFNCQQRGKEIASRVRNLQSGCIIEVASFAVVPLGIADHSFILFTDKEGEEFEYRGGPNRIECYERDPGRAISNFESDPNYICAQTNRFTRETAVDWEAGHIAPRTVLLVGECVCSKRSCLNDTLQNINRLRKVYTNLPPIYNSNSVVRTLLEKCNIPVIRPLLSGNLPGWENLLE